MLQKGDKYYHNHQMGSSLQRHSRRGSTNNGSIERNRHYAGLAAEKELMECYADEASCYLEKFEWETRGAEHHKWKTDLGAKLGIPLLMDDNP